MATTSTAPTATATLAAAAPASERERRPEPAGSAANEAPSDIAGRPPSSPVSRALPAERFCGARDDAAVTGARTSDIATSVSAAPVASVGPSQRSPGSGSASAAAPRGNSQLNDQATSGTASEPATTPTIATAAVANMRCGRVRPIALSAGWSAAEPATSRPSAWATRRRPPNAATAVAIHSVETPTSMLGTMASPTAFEWRDVETVRCQDLIDLGGDRVEAVLVDAEVDERLDVGDLVGVSAGEPLRELDDRERRLEVTLGPDDGGHLDLDRRSVERIAGSELGVVGCPLAEARR